MNYYKLETGGVLRKNLEGHLRILGWVQNFLLKIIYD
jgi:hypothetical protein